MLFDRRGIRMIATNRLAFTFPGQGSQSVGMLAALADAYPQVRETFDEASHALGVNLWEMSQNGPAEALNLTENTQPALLTAGIAVWRVWRTVGGQTPDCLAGHSLGEYTALVAAEVMSLGDAVRLVATRGRLMQTAVPVGFGAMAAIIGLDDASVRRACAEAAQNEIVSAANLNTPDQVVIAGHRSAVDRAMALTLKLGARKAISLAVSAPSHCALMLPAAKQLAQYLEEIELLMPVIPIAQNATAACCENLEQLREALTQQLHQPVRWAETVRQWVSDGVTRVAECGPGKVLSGLVRRIDRRIDVRALELPDGLVAARAAWT